jgi:hypothetical protein
MEVGLCLKLEFSHLWHFGHINLSIKIRKIQKPFERSLIVGILPIVYNSQALEAWIDSMGPCS